MRERVRILRNISRVVHDSRGCSGRQGGVYVQSGRKYHFKLKRRSASLIRSMDTCQGPFSMTDHCFCAWWKLSLMNTLSVGELSYEIFPRVYGKSCFFSLFFWHVGGGVSFVFRLVERIGREIDSVEKRGKLLNRRVSLLISRCTRRL